MLAFRSEVHIDRWCEQTGRDRGAAFSFDLMWRLADEWYRHRLSPE
jgi:hypothetical protein